MKFSIKLKITTHKRNPDPKLLSAQEIGARNPMKNQKIDILASAQNRVIFSTKEENEIFVSLPHRN